jgi:PAS domain S-box-containing protein
MLATKCDGFGDRGYSRDLPAFEVPGLPMIATNTAFEIHYLNDRACEMTGYSREEALGKKLFDIAPGCELKKRSLNAMFRGARHGFFSSRGHLLTKNGRVRKVKWHGQALQRPEGVLLAFIDQTEQEMMRAAARTIPVCTTVEEMAASFMYLLSEPLNLKFARISLSVSGKNSLVFTRAFPHGGLRKKPRDALGDYRPAQQGLPESRHFRLASGPRGLGVLELTPYPGSALSGDDEACIRALCDIASSGFARLIPAEHGGFGPSLPRDSPAAAAVVDVRTRRIVDATGPFSRLAGCGDARGMPIEEALPDAEIVALMTACVSDGLPYMGSSGQGRRAFCCAPSLCLAGAASSVIITLAEHNPSGSGAKKIDGLISMMPHGFAILDAAGIIMIANEAMVKIVGIDSKEIVGLGLAELVERLSPRRAGGSRIGVQQLAAYRTIKQGRPVSNVVTTIQVNGFRRIVSIGAKPIKDDRGEVTGCMVSMRDMTTTEAIVQLGRLAISSGDVDDFIEEALDVVMNAARLKLAWLYTGDQRELRLKVQKGPVADMPVPACVEEPDPMNPGIPSRTMLKGKPVLIKDYRRCSSVRLFDALARKRAIRSMAGLPLRTESGTSGVLVVATGEEASLGESQLAELASMSDQIATGIERMSGPRA